MFGFIADAVETTLDVAESIVCDGELPTKRQVGKLVEAGLTLYAISEVTGIALDVLEGMTDDTD